jgi:hypothetical protein
VVVVGDDASDRERHHADKGHTPFNQVVVTASRVGGIHDVPF